MASAVPANPQPRLGRGGRATRPDPAISASTLGAGALASPRTSSCPGGRTGWACACRLRLQPGVGGTSGSRALAHPQPSPPPRPNAPTAAPPPPPPSPRRLHHTQTCTLLNLALTLTRSISPTHPHPLTPPHSPSLSFTLTLTLTFTFTFTFTPSLTPYCSYSHSLSHSLTHSLPHPPAHLLTHSLTHSLAHARTHPLTHSLTHSLTHLRTLPILSLDCSHAPVRRLSLQGLVTATVPEAGLRLSAIIGHHRRFPWLACWPRCAAERSPRCLKSSRRHGSAMASRSSSAVSMSQPSWSRGRRAMRPVTGSSIWLCAAVGVRPARVFPRSSGCVCWTR